MDFMNLHQAAHGDREFGFIAARMRLERKVVVGHWGDPEVHERIGAWTRAACARHDWEAPQDRALWREHARGRRHRWRQGRGPTAPGVQPSTAMASATSWPPSTRLTDADVDRLDRDLPRRIRRRRRPSGRAATAPTPCATAPGSSSGYDASSPTAGSAPSPTTFEDLHGLTQLPGLAVQRLMRDGYGFGAEGDWKTAVHGPRDEGDERRSARRRLLHGGLHVPPDDGAGTWSWARTCSRSARRSPPASQSSRSIPSRSAARPTRSASSSTPIRAPPSPPASRTWASGSGCRVVVDVVAPAPAACRACPSPGPCGDPRPDLAAAAELWIHAGGSHHTSLGFAVTTEHLADFAAMSGIEFLVDRRDDGARIVPRPAALERPLLPAGAGPLAGTDADVRRILARKRPHVARVPPDR